MQKKLLLAACCLILPSSLFGSDPPTEPLTTTQIVQGIVARSQAVFSGKIQYHQEFGFPGKTPERSECEIVFTVSSWRLNSKLDFAQLPVVQTASVKKANLSIAPTPGTLELVKLSHHGKYVAYQHTPQPDGSMRDSAGITQEKVIDNSFPSPPVFAGSFWFPVTANFVKDNISEAQRMPGREVNGVRAEVLEWNVSDSNKFKAFNEINELTRNGGILRIFASPQLGYTLPRVEFLSPDGKLKASFDASNFIEVADGIFLPKNVGTQYYDAKGPGLHITYNITSAKNINQAIPDSEFVLELSYGTHIAYGLSGNESVLFEIKEDGGIPNELKDVIGVHTPAFWGRNWYTALILGAVLGLLLIGSYFAIRKWVPRRHKI